MRRFMPVLVSSIMVLFVASLGIGVVEPMPVYAQEILLNAPDLSGLNIYFSEANAEPSRFDRSNQGISRYAGLLRLMGASLFTLEWRNGIPADADLIVIAGPSADLSQNMVARLWAYMQRGGRVMLLADPINNKGSVSRALGSDGLFELTWSDFGIQARSDVLVREGPLHQVDIVERNRDEEITFEFSGEVPVLESRFLTHQVDATHPITSGLSDMLTLGDGNETANLHGLYFDTARSLEIDAALQNSAVTPLIFTDMPEMYGETKYATYLSNGFVEYNIGEDSQRGDLILAAALEAPGTDARMVLIGDVDVIRNGTGFAVSPSYSGSFVYPANAQFMIRSSAWLLSVEPRNIQQLPTPAATPTVTITPTATPEPTATAAAQ